MGNFSRRLRREGEGTRSNPQGRERHDAAGYRIDDEIDDFLEDVPSVANLDVPTAVVLRQHGLEGTSPMMACINAAAPAASEEIRTVVDTGGRVY